MTPEEIETRNAKQMRLIDEHRAKITALDDEKAALAEELGKAQSDAKTVAAEHKKAVAELTRAADANIAARDQAYADLKAKTDRQAEAFVSGAKAIAQSLGDLIGTFTDHPDVKAARLAKLQAEAERAAKALEEAKG